MYLLVSRACRVNCNFQGFALIGQAFFASSNVLLCSKLLFFNYFKDFRMNIKSWSNSNKLPSESALKKNSAYV